ncbi:hypothetical protein ZWY2020_031054 [Hordeum vulgare]|nr:hypothetical protein ZWY2020_031054 [Hordeum vulgare]
MGHRIAMSMLCTLIALLLVGIVSANDEAALLAFKAQLIHGGSLASWNSSASFCNWKGVTCGHWRPARVVALILNGNRPTGAVSPTIGNLTFLRTLKLSFNSLHGDIPASLGRLHRLQRLYLDDNSFSGTLPANLSSCVRMTEMGLDNNILRGASWLSSEKLTYLALVTLRSNSFTGHILSHWPVCPVYGSLTSTITNSLAQSHGSAACRACGFNLFETTSLVCSHLLYNWSS